MKKILVTGSTGFIGNYVVTELVRRGYEVIATSVNEEKAASMEWYSRVKYIPFDLKTVQESANYYDFFKQPDALIHLAWEGLPNYKSSFHIEENLPVHCRFIENLVNHGLRDITVAGTCFEYGLQEGCLSEDMPAQPGNAYSIAKNQFRLFIADLAGEIPLSFKWVRLFYMYGKGQSPNSLLSQLQSALDRGDTEFNMSPGDQLRDYLPIEKVADCLVEVASQQAVTGIVNCCSGRPIQVKELVMNYLKEKNKHIRLNLGYYPYSDIEPRNFWGDTSKLKTILTNE